MRIPPLLNTIEEAASPILYTSIGLITIVAITTLP